MQWTVNPNRHTSILSIVSQSCLSQAENNFSFSPIQKPFQELKAHHFIRTRTVFLCMPHFSYSHEISSVILLPGHSVSKFFNSFSLLTIIFAVLNNNFISKIWSPLFISDHVLWYRSEHRCLKLSWKHPSTQVTFLSFSPTLCFQPLCQLLIHLETVSPRQCLLKFLIC